MNWLISLVVLWIMMIGKSTLSFFNVSTKCGGPHSIDRLADIYNSHLPRFNSVPRCGGCRCRLGWREEQLMVPTTWASDEGGETCRTVSYYWNTCGAFLESAPFWPLLCPDSSNYASFVVDIRKLPAVARRGRLGATLFKGDEPNNFMLALRICF